MLYIYNYTTVKVRLFCLLYCSLNFMYFFMSPPWPQQNCPFVGWLKFLNWIELKLNWIELMSPHSHPLLFQGYNLCTLSMSPHSQPLLFQGYMYTLRLHTQYADCLKRNRVVSTLRRQTAMNKLGHRVHTVEADCPTKIRTGFTLKKETAWQKLGQASRWRSRLPDKN